MIEEAPSPAVDPELREKMGDAAIQAARAVNYEVLEQWSFYSVPRMNSTSWR